VLEDVENEIFVEIPMPDLSALEEFSDDGDVVGPYDIRMYHSAV
jgi:hypothetical protein